jgi:hypothetical protein
LIRKTTVGVDFESSNFQLTIFFYREQSRRARPDGTSQYMNDCLLKHHLEDLLSEGFDDQIEVIVKSRESNPKKILKDKNSVQYLGINLYSL